MTTVDKIVAQAQQAPFDMMKLDIQGAELLALKGARAPDPRRGPAVPSLTGAAVRRRLDGDAEERAGDPGGDLERRVQDVREGPRCEDRYVVAKPWFRVSQAAYEDSHQRNVEEDRQ